MTPAAKERGKRQRAKLIKLVSADLEESWGIVHDPSQRPWQIHPFSPEGDERDKPVPWEVIARLQDGSDPRQLVAFGARGTAATWLRRQVDLDWEQLLRPYDPEHAMTPEQVEAAQAEFRELVERVAPGQAPQSFEAWKRLHEAGVAHTLEIFDDVACSDQAQPLWVPAGQDVPIADDFWAYSCRWQGTAVIQDQAGGQVWTAADLTPPDPGTDPCTEVPIAARSAAKFARTS